jgi:hypothetical protein
MVKCYIKTAEEQLRKAFASYQRDWDTRLTFFLLAYRASTPDTTDLTPGSLVFGRELLLSCDLLFGHRQTIKRPTINHAANLVDHLHDIHNYARQHLKLASKQMKTRYDRLANCAGYHEGDRAWVYHPTRMKGKSPEHQPSWEGPCKRVTLINNVVYRIQKYPRSRIMVVHPERLAPYQGTARDERP